MLMKHILGDEKLAKPIFLFLSQNCLFLIISKRADYFANHGIDFFLTKAR